MASVSQANFLQQIDTDNLFAITAKSTHTYEYVGQDRLIVSWRYAGELKAYILKVFTFLFRIQPRRKFNDLQRL